MIQKQESQKVERRGKKLREGHIFSSYIIHTGFCHTNPLNILMFVKVSPNGLWLSIINQVFSTMIQKIWNVNNPQLSKTLYLQETNPMSYIGNIKTKHPITLLENKHLFTFRLISGESRLYGVLQADQRKPGILVYQTKQRGRKPVLNKRDYKLMLEFMEPFLKNRERERKLSPTVGRNTITITGFIP